MIDRRDTCEYHNGPSHEAEVIHRGIKFARVHVRCDQCGRVRGIRLRRVDQ